MTPPPPEDADDEGSNILDIIHGHWQAAGLAAGVTHGVFDALAGGPLTSADVARSCRLPVSNATLLLEGLVGMGVLETSGVGATSRYRNTSAANRYLVPGTPEYLGDLALTLTDTGGSWRLWDGFAASVAMSATERDTVGPPPDFDNDAYKLGIANAIIPLTRRAAGLTVERLIADGVPVHRILDVGGGSGVFAETLLHAYPNATALQVDYPRINRQARERLDRTPVSGRFETLDGQFPDVPLDDRFDLVLYSGYSHQLGEAQNRMQLQACARLLADGGHLVFHDYVSTDDGTKDPSRITSLNWLLVGFGQVWPLATVADWLTACGLEVKWTRPTGLWMTLVVAGRTHCDAHRSQRE
ncbi:MAG: class I SAM-dependent methyltransferase [Acidimicrobiales bacterium]